MKEFRTVGICNPEKHYMVDISNKLEQISKLVDKGDYFTINRARQYGKTTTLYGLERMLESRYTVISISFEDLGRASFATEETFCNEFMAIIKEALEFTDTPEEYKESWFNPGVKTLKGLSRHITRMTKGKKVVLMIDEVDKTSNNEVFLNFLSVLRSKYLAREKNKDYTFYSVILAGVYDIKSIKLKLINEEMHEPKYGENSTHNSPWNIAVDFEVDMSFKPIEISTMLQDYEEEHHTGMDINAVAQEIYKYTSGYPFLVSRVCQHIDNKFDKDWTLNGILNAVKILTKEENTLFENLSKNLENHKSLYHLLYDVLIVGRKRIFSIDNPTIKLGTMYGFIKDSDQGVSIANKIFEMRICNYFITHDEELNTHPISNVLQNDIVINKKFNMELCLKKFAQHYTEIFNEMDIKFLERHGRLIFLSYIKPLLNGRGFYHIESQFTDLRQMDIVVDFGTDQFIIELKIWRGQTLQQEAYEQLLGYMESANTDKGYLLTFDFRNEKNKVRKAEWVQLGNKQIFDVMI